ncbi:MAG: glycine cleavage system aminomethyltransferase GcvT [Betaproteobacteria bacterium]|nr:glycine cleavage system aminomethyltransferase GcvT [Betaproteobacteria bacterium]
MSDALKTTPLHAAHRALGAKMVDFAGWEMPLHYGSQIEEHHQIRRAVGMFDVSHMLAADIRGADVREFLRALLANDVAKLRQPGKALYSCMLDPEGRVIDDLIVYCLAGERFRVVVNAGTAVKDIAWIDAQRARRAPGVELEPRRDLAILAVQGPHAREKVWRALPQVRGASEPLVHFQAAEVGDTLVARTGYTGEDGFEIMLPAARATDLWNALRAQGVAPAGLGARDTLRLEAGMNLYGQDMDETVTPFESGLAWTVDLGTDRDFIGKAALIARPAARQLIGLMLVARGVMRAHQAVRCAGGGGETTSGGFSPTLNQSIALARVPSTLAAGDGVEVHVRDKWLRAKAVKPPFVRNGRILVGAGDFLGER